MNCHKLIRHLMVVMAVAFCFSNVQPAPASAQGFFLFGGGGGKTRQVMNFSKRYSPRQIIVSFGDRKLYYITRRGEAISYPIAVPSRDARWSGVHTVTSKRVNPSWVPTPEMRRKNPRLPTYVPGGHPRNPLGVRALYIGSTMYRIHGTDAPWQIGDAVSSGCIRMFNNHVIDLYKRVPVGTKVTVTWKRYKSY